MSTPLHTPPAPPTLLHADPWMDQLACSHFTLVQDGPDGWFATDGTGAEIPGSKGASIAECLAYVRGILPNAAHGGTIFGEWRERP